jgi:hypothetical protein
MTAVLPCGYLHLLQVRVVGSRPLVLLAELEAVFPTDFPWLCPLGCKLAVFLRLCLLILLLPLRASLGLVLLPAAAL